jgi:hypothetical protein
MRNRNKILLCAFVFLLVWSFELSIPTITRDLYCSGVVKTITLSSAYLYSGQAATNSAFATSSLLISFNNPGSNTRITSLVLWSGSTTTTNRFYNGTQFYPAGNGTIFVAVSGGGTNVTMITSWDNSTQPSSAGNLILFNSSQLGNNVLSSGRVASFTYYPESFGSPLLIAKGQIFNYAVSFSNGDSISGSLIAQ